MTAVSTSTVIIETLADLLEQLGSIAPGHSRNYSVNSTCKGRAKSLSALNSLSHRIDTVSGKHFLSRMW
jgi:hypothetical protein